MDGRVVWTLDAFEALGGVRLERILRARQEVFILEQRCLYADLDGLDARCWHLAAWAAGSDAADGEGHDDDDPGRSSKLPLACARLLPPGLKFDVPAIGRVLTFGPGRSCGLGAQLMAEALKACERLWPGHGQALSAQQHLTGWYARFGFVEEGEAYDEDGIAHQDMRRGAGAAAPVSYTHLTLPTKRIV